jgi:RimJ/RimL family protein N-acetyltransferase
VPASRNTIPATGQASNASRKLGAELTILTAPAESLTDGVVQLRLPSPDAGDVTTVNGYIDNDQLDGGWLPDVPLVPAQQLVADWLDGWAGRQSRNGPAFVVTVADEPGFVGVIGMTEHDDGAFDIEYGTAPVFRGRGLASRATRLAAQWMSRQPSVRTVEVLIGDGQRACERVAVKAGFVLDEATNPPDPGSGAAVQLRYIMQRRAAPE